MAGISKLTIDISDNTRVGLERLAGNSEAGPAILASQAIAFYVEQELKIVENIQTGLSDLKAGNVVPHDEAMAEISALIDAAQAKRA